MTEENTNQLQPIVAPAPPPLPPQVLGYATPLGAGPMASGIWRDGERVITTVQAALPMLCIKCNAPADGSYKSRTFWWHHPALAIMIVFPGILIYAIVAMIVRKKAVVQVGLCRRHNSRRVKLILITWLMGLAVLPAIIGGFISSDAYREQNLMFVGLIVGIGLLIAAVVTGTMRTLKPTKIDQMYGYFKGCGPEFLAQFSTTR